MQKPTESLLASAPPLRQRPRAASEGIAVWLPPAVVTPQSAKGTKLAEPRRTCFKREGGVLWDEICSQAVQGEGEDMCLTANISCWGSRLQSPRNIPVLKPSLLLLLQRFVFLLADVP